MATGYPYGLVSQQRTWSYASGWQAEQVFCVAFDSDFEIDNSNNVDGSYSGVDDFISKNYLVFYPGSTLLQVTQIKDEQWMDGDIVLPSGFSNARKVTFSYGIVYLNVGWPDQLTMPDYQGNGDPSGTTLKLKHKFAGQYMTIPPAGIKPTEGGPAAGPDTQATQFISLDEFEIEWDRVQNLGDLDFNDLIGCVNTDTFMGYSPGTLLCEGVSQENSTILNPDDPMAWKSTVTIKRRCISVASGDNAGTYGWNDYYNVKTQKWEPLVLTNGQPPYEKTSFAGMFS